MRSLIRPALFILVRLGLFLSIVAWVAGQWWYISIAPGLQKSYAVLGVYPDGMMLGLSGSPVDAGIELQPVEAVAGANPGVIFGAEEEFYEIAAETEAYLALLLPDVLAILWNSNDAIAAIRYWVAVAFFAVLYCLLKWVYRKR